MDNNTDQKTPVQKAIPLLAGCEIAGKDITADALLTQRELARYIVARQAHYHFTVKGNQPTLEHDIALLFAHPTGVPPTLPRASPWRTGASKRDASGAVAH